MCTCRRYFLRAGGVDADKNLKDLESTVFRAASEPSVPVDTDISICIRPPTSCTRVLTKHKSYLRSRKDQNVASSTKEDMCHTARDFGAFIAKNVTAEWEMQAVDIRVLWPCVHISRKVLGTFGYRRGKRERKRM